MVTRAVSFRFFPMLSQHSKRAAPSIGVDLTVATNRRSIGNLVFATGQRAADS